MNLGNFDEQMGMMSPVYKMNSSTHIKTRVESSLA